MLSGDTEQDVSNPVNLLVQYRMRDVKQTTPFESYLKMNCFQDPFQRHLDTSFSTQYITPV